MIRIQYTWDHLNPQTVYITQKDCFKRCLESVIALIINTIDGIDKPALAGLWPNQNSMNIVLDLGANIECNEKTLTDFACMGSALYKSLFNIDKPKVALLNVGLEEHKGNDVLKKTFSMSRPSFVLLGYVFCAAALMNLKAGQAVVFAQHSNLLVFQQKLPNTNPLIHFV